MIDFDIKQKVKKIHAFYDWLDKCPVDFTVIEVNGTDQYLFGEDAKKMRRMLKTVHEG
jgi:hypothetical protein